MERMATVRLCVHTRVRIACSHRGRDCTHLTGMLNRAGMCAGVDRGPLTRPFHSCVCLGAALLMAAVAAFMVYDAVHVAVQWPRAQRSSRVLIDARETQVRALNASNAHPRLPAHALWHP